MYHETLYHENNPKLDYLNQKLVEGREHIIQMSPLIHRTPFFYEPEICEIHNETLDTKKDNLHKVILNDDNLARESIRKQAIRANATNTKNNNEVKIEYNVDELKTLLKNAKEKL
jgi:hypothetical protein